MPASQPANFNLQEFTDAGLLLVGGRLYTYAQGTTTQKTAYTDPAGTVPHTYTADGIGGQFIALNARGELPTPLYLADGSYDLCLKRADGSTVWTRKADGVESGTNLLATTAGAGLIGFVQAGIGAVASTAQRKLRDSVTVLDFGAKGDWDGVNGTDDSAAFQAAIDYVASIGGGEVRVPPVAKAYRLAAMITVKSGVRLIGASGRPSLNFYATTINDYYGGYCLAIDWGAGVLTGMAIRQAPKTAISGLTIIYPGQVTSLLASAPTIFPPTISGVQFDAPGGIIENINFVNSYKAIYFPMGHGELAIRHITGQILNDFITLNGVINADQLTDINASGVFYLRSSPDFNFTNNTGLLNYIQKNGKAFVIGYADAIRFNECFVGNCYAGIYFGNAPAVGTIATQYAYGDWNGGGMEGVTFPVYVDGSATSGINSNGFRFTGVGFAPVGLYNADRSLSCLLVQPSATFDDQAGERAKLIFTACTFWGSGNWQANVGPLLGHFQSTGGDIECYGCTFKIWQSYVASAFSGKCSFKFSGCTFLDYRATSSATYHFQSAAGTTIRLFLGGGNDFKNFFGTNFATGTAEVYETSQPYSFPTPILQSVDPLPVPAIGRHFIVNGSGAITSIDSPYKDRMIVLEFLGTATIADNANVRLSSAFAATADDTLTLIGDGTTWREVSRSYN